VRGNLFVNLDVDKDFSVFALCEQGKLEVIEVGFEDTDLLFSSIVLSINGISH